MVEGNRRQHRGERGRDDVGRVLFPAKPAFDYADIGFFPCKIQKGKSGRELKLRKPFGIVRMAQKRGETAGNARKILLWNRCIINCYGAPVPGDGGRKVQPGPVARGGQDGLYHPRGGTFAVGPRDMHKSKAEFGAAALA